jgi:hypothetical protein
MTNIKERVLYISEIKGVKRELFFEQLGLSYANFKGIQKKSALSSDAIDKIITKYNDIDANWLITGKGSMLKRDVVTEVIVTPVVHDQGINYKDLADARLQIIEMKDEKIARLQKDLSELKYTQKETFLYQNVAEPAPELKEKETK